MEMPFFKYPLLPDQLLQMEMAWTIAPKTQGRKVN